MKPFYTISLTLVAALHCPSLIRQWWPIRGQRVACGVLSELPSRYGGISLVVAQPNGGCFNFSTASRSLRSINELARSILWHNESKCSAVTGVDSTSPGRTVAGNVTCGDDSFMGGGHGISRTTLLGLKGQRLQQDVENGHHTTVILYRSNGLGYLIASKVAL